MPANLFASQGSVILMSAFLVILSAANGLAMPEKWIAWAGIIMLAIGALILMAVVQNAHPATRRNIHRSLFAAGVSISIALAFSLGESFDIIPEAASKRAAGVLIGLILAAAGNFLPKAVIPVSARSCDPARAARAERLVGWVTMLAGIAFAAIWIFAPIDAAKIGSALAGLMAFFTALTASIWLHATDLGKQQED